MSYEHRNERASRYARQKSATEGKVKAQMAEYQLREATRAAEVAALERLQAQRPKKPPSRRL